MKFIIPFLILGISASAQKIKEQQKDSIAKNQSLKEVKVIIKESPNNRKETILSGLDIKPMDLPQSIQIISNATIYQQQSVRLSDVVKNANGVYVGSARGGAQESFWSRGYDLSANNMLKNGFRQNGGYMPEVATLEKIEILKGNAALLLGNVAPGGIINMVTKAPSFTKGGEINVQTGSYAFYKPTLDFYGPISKNIAYRLVGTYENSESFRNNVTRDRLYVNPSVLLKASSKTDITIQGDYLNDNWIPDFGTGGSTGTAFVNAHRNTYLGAVWSNGQTKQYSANGLVKHHFNSDWKLNFNTSFQDYDRTWVGTERIQPLANGDWTRPLGKNKSAEKIMGGQINIQGILNTGKIKHQVFAGTDVENSFAQAYTFVFNPTSYDIINIFDPTKYTPRTDIPTATNTLIVNTDTNRFGIFAQDLISLTKQLKVLAGVRWSWQEATAETKTISTQSATKGEPIKSTAISPKLGLVYQPNATISVFGSYSNSFTPNTGITISKEPLSPSLIDQYEIGIKKDFLKKMLSTNITLYQIVNSNLAQTAEFKADGSINTDTNVKILSGETTSKGIEIDILSKPVEGLNIMAGYSYNDMRYTKTNGATGSFIQGERVTRTPDHTANFSFFYTIPYGKLKGLSFGSVINYIGRRLGGWNNTVGQTQSDRIIQLSDYTTADLSAGYDFKKWSILCKLSNLTNELNYTVHENYSFNPIAPRQVMASIKYKL